MSWALAARVARFACHGCPVSGLDVLASARPVTVRDLDGDGEPEVLIDLFTGGAHCCFYTVILRYDGGTYRGTVAFWGDPDYSLRADLDRDGRPELVTADDRFAYAFTFYAASVLPIRIESYDHGTLTDVTSRFPSLVRAEAASLCAEYLKERGAGRATCAGSWPPGSRTSTGSAAPTRAGSGSRPPTERGES